MWGSVRAIGAAIAVLFLSVFSLTTAYAAERTVVVVLFDGFPPRLLSPSGTPNLNRIAKEGAWSADLVPAFPTISLINHTTFATGCWPEHHGVMSNEFYDPKLGKFGEAMQKGDADWHTGCEAMWEAAERQGVRAAAFNFVGRWSAKRGKLATYANPLVPWKDTPSDDVTLASALKLLKDNSPNHPRLIALYFRGPDEAEHEHGTVSPEAQAEARKADVIVGKLMAAIAALPKDREGTLVIGTDHGMMDVGPMINVTRLMNKLEIKGKAAADGASAFVYLDKDENEDRVVKALGDYKDMFSVYRKGHYPAYAHLGLSGRAGDLLLISRPPYWMADSSAFPPWAAWLGINWVWPVAFTPFIGGIKATHGYDPAMQQMHGIFYAWGAGIAKGKKIDRLDMIDVHPTVMALLGLQPGKPVDGRVVTEMMAK
ncbi:MAG: alkaline phosphatase family protein [Proteobacteria bacterium]|nr:alkaline phosphatase family protein [Pseudomonadota bacterium]